jgi:hypothetical protein
MGANSPSVVVRRGCHSIQIEGIGVSPSDTEVFGGIFAGGTDSDGPDSAVYMGEARTKTPGLSFGELPSSAALRKELSRGEIRG